MLLARLSLAGWLGLFSLLGCGQTSQHGGAGGAGAGADSSAGRATGGAVSAGAGGGAGAGRGGEVAGGAPAQCDVVKFEDPVVEAAVRERLGLSPAATLDGELIGRMGGQLDIVGGSSLRGLECATSLGTIATAGGKLDDLSPLRALPKLKSLIFRETVISDAALRGSWFPPALRELSFFDVAIVDLTLFKAASDLVLLVVDGGMVTDLTPLASSSQLQELSLDDNPLEDLTPLSALTNLRSLSIARTQVKSLEALAGLSLQQLNISGSAVTSLQGVAAPRTPEQCAHVWAEDVPLTESAWATERDQLCSVGWAVRASRSADADPVTCGKWCDTR
jgi:internalin A